MTNYEAWLYIIKSLDLEYEHEIFLEGMLYLMKDDSSSELSNPLIIKIIEFLRKEE